MAERRLEKSTERGEGTIEGGKRRQEVGWPQLEIPGLLDLAILLAPDVT